MKKLLLSASLLLVTSPAFAQQAVSAQVSALSDYTYRGISRSDEHPALQGEIQINHPSGLFAGVQGTTVDLNADNDANVEAVLFGGMQGDYTGIKFKGTVSYNTYPGGDNDDLDYWEFTAEGDYDFGPFQAGLTWAFSPNYINDSGMSFYYGADVAAPLQNYGLDLTAKAHLGFQMIDDENRYAEDYADWSMGLWYNWAQYDVDFGLQYVDTDIDDRDCVESCGSRAVLSATKAISW